MSKGCVQVHNILYDMYLYSMYDYNGMTIIIPAADEDSVCWLLFGSVECILRELS